MGRITKLSEKKEDIKKLDLTEFTTSQGEMIANLLDMGFKGKYQESKNLIEGEYRGFPMSIALGQENMNVTLKDTLISKNPKKLVNNLRRLLDDLDN